MKINLQDKSGKSENFPSGLSLRGLCELTTFSSSTFIMLMITHSCGGGTEKHVQELYRFIGKRKIVFELRPIGDLIDFRENQLYPHFVHHSALKCAYPSIHPISAQKLNSLPLLNCLQSPHSVNRFKIRFAHIHQLFSVPIDVSKLLRELKLPFYFTVHDYDTICPRVHLKTVHNKYCKELGLHGCNECVGANRTRGISIESWRKHFEWIYNHAMQIICPSQDVAVRLQSYHPQGNYIVVPHSYLSQDRQPEKHVVKPCYLHKNDVLRIAVLGSLSRFKGAGKVFECISASQKKNGEMQFHLIGELDNRINDTNFDQNENLFEIHGKYDSRNILKIIEQVAPHIIWFPVQLPETYSYTLSEAFMSGLPVAAPNIGAFSERVAERPWTWLVDWELNGSQMNDFFIEVRAHLVNRTPPPMTIYKYSATKMAKHGNTDFYSTSYGDLNPQRFHPHQARPL